MFPSLPIGAGADQTLCLLQSHLTWEWMLTVFISTADKRQMLLLSRVFFVLWKNGFRQTGLTGSRSLITAVCSSSEWQHTIRPYVTCVQSRTAGGDVECPVGFVWASICILKLLCCLGPSLLAQESTMAKINHLKALRLKALLSHTY